MISRNCSLPKEVTFMVMYWLSTNANKSIYIIHPRPQCDIRFFYHTENTIHLGKVQFGWYIIWLGNETQSKTYLWKAQYCVNESWWPFQAYGCTWFCKPLTADPTRLSSIYASTLIQFCTLTEESIWLQDEWENSDQNLSEYLVKWTRVEVAENTCT